MKIFLRLILALFFFGFTPGEKNVLESEKETCRIDRHELTAVGKLEKEHFRKFQHQAKTVLE